MLHSYAWNDHKKLGTLSVSLRYYRYHMSLVAVVVKQSNVIRKEQYLLSVLSWQITTTVRVDLSGSTK